MNTSKFHVKFGNHVWESKNCHNLFFSVNSLYLGGGGYNLYTQWIVLHYKRQVFILLQRKIFFVHVSNVINQNVDELKIKYNFGFRYPLAIFELDINFVNKWIVPWNPKDWVFGVLPETFCKLMAQILIFIDARLILRCLKIPSLGSICHI